MGVGAKLGPDIPEIAAIAQSHLGEYLLVNYLVLEVLSLYQPVIGAYKPRACAPGRYDMMQLPTELTN